MSLEKLHEACAAGDLIAVRQHVSKVDDIDARNDRGWNALIMAAFNQHQDVVRFLVEEMGADINACNPKGTTVFMYAKTAVIRSRDTALLEYLIERGVDLNATDMFGKTVLDYVSEQEDAGWLKHWLMARGCTYSTRSAL